MWKKYYIYKLKHCKSGRPDHNFRYFMAWIYKCLFVYIIKKCLQLGMCLTYQEPNYEVLQCHEKKLKY